MRLRRSVLVLWVLLLLSVVLAACGSGGTSTSSTGSTSSTASTSGETSEGATGEAKGDSGVEAAEKVVAEYEKEHPFEEIPKLGQTPKEGTAVTLLSCPLPACQRSTEGAKAAAEALGWNVKSLTYEFTPESYASRFSEIAREKPEALFFISAFPNETVASQISELEAAGVAMAQSAPPAGEGPTKGIPSVLLGFPAFEQGGEIAADMVVADGGPESNAAIVYDPTLGSLVASKTGWEKTLKKNCSSCTSGEIQLSASAPATQNLSKITNYLRQNSGVEYLFFTVGDLSAGLPEALASAGITDVKSFTRTPNEINMEDVADGKEWAAITPENETNGYRAIDALARQLNGENIEPESYPIGYTRIYTEETAEAGAPPNPPGATEAFLEAWGVNP